jgi:hypothetical protein
LVGIDDPDLLKRLCIFAKTGADGSMAAFWLDDEGKQSIVHMGSGSGSTLCCVLAEETIDFLRLIAIGYDEICWGGQFAYPPNSPDNDCDFYVHPNINYQNWVQSTFGVSIPEQASEIVKHPAKNYDSDSRDRFWRWIKQNAESYD